MSATTGLQQQWLSPASKRPLPPEDEVQISNQPSSSKMKLCDQSSSREDSDGCPRLDFDAIRTELTCSICLDLPTKVATIMPCLHSFCWSCIKQWLQHNHKCPRCSQAASEARPSATLTNLVEVLLGADPSLGKPDDIRTAEAEAFAEYKLNYSSTGSIPACHGGHPDDQDSDDDEDGAVAVFSQCPCCVPNSFGYSCLHPIPAHIPGADRLQMAGVRGGDWPQFSTARNILPSEACDAHTSCEVCEAWIPRQGLRSARCDGCQSYTCAPYDSQKTCPDTGEGPMARICQQLNAPMILAATLNGLPLSYPARQLHLNNEAEVTKLKAHVALQKITAQQILDCMMSKARSLLNETTTAPATNDASGPAINASSAAVPAPPESTAPTAGTQAALQAVPASEAADAAQDVDVGSSSVNTAAAECLIGACACLEGPCRILDTARAAALIEGYYCKECTRRVLRGLVGYWWESVRQQGSDAAGMNGDP